jgi:hypothetical protein
VRRAILGTATALTMACHPAHAVYRAFLNATHLLIISAKPEKEISRMHALHNGRH